MMRSTLITLLLLVIALPSAVAQDRPNTAPATTVESKFQEDLTMTSAMLKDTRGAVDAKLLAVNKQLSTATGENKAKWTGQKEQLVDAQKTVDQMLDMVNSAKPEDWQRIRSKAQAVNDMVRDMISAM